MQNYSLVFNSVITPKLVNQLLLGVNYLNRPSTISIPASTRYRPVSTPV